MKHVVLLLVMAGTMVLLGCDKNTSGGGNRQEVSIPRVYWPRDINNKDITARWNAGPFSSDFIITITNSQKEQLLDLNLTFKFYPAQGNPIERKAFQALISEGESQSVVVNVPNGRYQKVEVIGSGKGGNVRPLGAEDDGRYQINMSFYYR